MLDKIIPDNIIKMMIKFAKSVGPQAISLAQRNEFVVKTLKELKLDPTQPPQDIDGVYVYALVEYGVDKEEPLLQLFREKEIKNAFWNAYTDNNPMSFSKKVDDFIQSSALGDEIRELKVDIRSELEDFGQAFISVAKRSKSPQFRILSFIPF